MSAPVFIHEGSGRPLTAYQAGDIYVLAGPEGRHAAVVQRLGPGEEVDVVDGLGRRLHCRVTAADSQLTTRVDRVTCEPAPELPISLVQALAKGDRDSLAIEAAVECGVDAIIPWQASRSVVVWRGERAHKSHSKWQSTVRAASKQSRRAWLPPVSSLHSTAVLTARITEQVSAGGVALVLHEQGREPISQAQLPAVGCGGRCASEFSTAECACAAGSDAAASADSASALPALRGVLVIVGPEGGISDEELVAFTQAGAQCVRLGPHVMRTSTAGPVAVALLSERLGRWDMVL